MELGLRKIIHIRKKIPVFGQEISYMTELRKCENNFLTYIRKYVLPETQKK